MEGFQAGLAWITVLRKRGALRAAFHEFDPRRVVEMDVEPLMADSRLIRSGPKLRACVRNARATLDLPTGLPALILDYVADTPAPTTWSAVPASTEASAALAKRLKRLGFTFVGPTTAYSLLQACGLVNDHLAGCHVRNEVEAERSAALSSLSAPVEGRRSRSGPSASG